MVVRFLYLVLLAVGSRYVYEYECFGIRMCVSVSEGFMM